MLLLQSNALAGTPRGAIPGQILVKFRPNPAGPGLQAARDLSGARLQADAPLLGWQLLGLAPGSDLETELARFKARADVEFAEPNYRIERFSTPNDPRLNELWGLQAIRASQAWQHSTGSSQVVVAVIDGGIDASQADLVPNLWVNPGEIAGNGIDDDLNGATDDVHGFNTFPPGVPSTDDDGHGSHVAGIIGATGNNGIGTAGVCWNVRLLAIKIFTADDGTGTAGAVRGYDYLLELRRRGVNIRVVNNSWGGPVPSLALREAICRAEAAGILSICAAGNRAVDTDYQPAFPAGLDCDGILSVAASRPDDGRASFSNFGNRTVDLAAPGERILSTYRRDGRYEFLSGTSMAAPFVSGVAALLWSHSSQLTPSQVKTVILASARPHPAWAGHTLTGGILDAGEAMARVVTGNFDPPTLTPSSARGWPRLDAATHMPQQRWPSQASSFQAFSGDGQTVAYTAAASSTGGSPGVTNLYLKHLRDGQIWTVDRWNGGNVSLSRDGRHVAYDSGIDVPLLGDSNGSYDVFVWDRQTGVRELVSRTGNRSGNSSSGNSFISASGRFVVFSTDATDLFAGDVNGQRDILLRDRQLGSTRVISANAAGSIGNGFSDDAVVSENGQYVAFMSGSGNLTADPNPTAYQIYLRDWVNNTVVRVSAFPNGVQGDGSSYVPSLSADGRFLAFYTEASNLFPNDTNGLPDVVLWDRTTRQLTPASVGQDGVQGDQHASIPKISGDGRHVVFASRSRSLVPPDESDGSALFSFDRLTRILTRHGFNEAGYASLDSLYPFGVDDSGRRLSFSSASWNLVPGDGNGFTEDVFVLDRGRSAADLGIRTALDPTWQGLGLQHALVSQRVEASVNAAHLATFEAQLINASSESQPFSLQTTSAPEGWMVRYFVGASEITQLLIPPNSYTQHLAAAAVGLPIRIEIQSLSPGTGEAWCEARLQVSSPSAPLDPPIDAVSAVARRRPSPPSHQVLSKQAGGPMGKGASGSAAVSQDGRWVAFESEALGFHQPDENLSPDVFLLDRLDESVRCLSRSFEGGTGDQRSTNPSMSEDGRFVAFESEASDLVGGDFNARRDVFLHDALLERMTLISVTSGGFTLSRDSRRPRLSGDGRYTVFETLSRQIATLDTNETWDLVQRDNRTGLLECISCVNGVTGDDESTGAAVSRDGRWVAFSSHARGLATGDTNQASDVFLWDRTTRRASLISRTSSARPANASSGGVSISADGRWVCFSSRASDLDVEHWEAHSSIFLFDNFSNRLMQVSPPLQPGRQSAGYFGGRISPDGAWITLLASLRTSPASTNELTSVLLFERATGLVTEISRTQQGSPADGESFGAVMSASSRHVLFESRAANLLREYSNGSDQLIAHDRASFQPDQWIRRNPSTSYRGQDQYQEAPQRVEALNRLGTTNLSHVIIFNHGTYPDRFLIIGDTNTVFSGGVEYFLTTPPTNITAAVLSGGWQTPPLQRGELLEIGVRTIINDARMFERDLLIQAFSLNDPFKRDTVRLVIRRDEDGDQLPDLWEQQLLGGIGAQPGQDNDGDGVSNLDEYTAGTHPNSALSSLRIEEFRAESDASLLMKWRGVSGRTYKVEGAVGVNGTFENLGEMPGVDGVLEHREFSRSGGEARIFRLRVERD